jgi:hypothetical protein
VYSTNRRYAAILRLHEKVPDFGRRKSTLVLNDPIPRWHNVPLAIYDRRKKISEFEVDFSVVDDVFVADSGRYIVGVLRTKSYPCAAPPRDADDQIVTIFQTNGALVSAIKLEQVLSASQIEVERFFGPTLDYSLSTGEDGREILVITRDGKVLRRVVLATGVMLENERP